jgi:hypothetical protein
MVQVIEHLPSMCIALSSNPIITRQKTERRQGKKGREVEKKRGKETRKK